MILHDWKPKRAWKPEDDWKKKLDTTAIYSHSQWNWLLTSCTLSCRKMSEHCFPLGMFEVRSGFVPDIAVFSWNGMPYSRLSRHSHLMIPHSRAIMECMIHGDCYILHGVDMSTYLGTGNWIHGVHDSCSHLRQVFVLFVLSLAERPELQGKLESEKNQIYFTVGQQGCTIIIL